MTKFSIILIQCFYIEAGGKFMQEPVSLESRTHLTPGSEYEKWFNLMIKFNTILIQWLYIEAGGKFKKGLDY